MLWGLLYGLYGVNWRTEFSIFGEARNQYKFTLMSNGVSNFLSKV